MVNGGYASLVLASRLVNEQQSRLVARLFTVTKHDIVILWLRAQKTNEHCYYIGYQVAGRIATGETLVITEESANVRRRFVNTLHVIAPASTRIGNTTTYIRQKWQYR